MAHGLFSGETKTARNSSSKRTVLLSKQPGEMQIGRTSYR